MSTKLHDSGFDVNPMDELEAAKELLVKVLFINKAHDAILFEDRPLYKKILYFLDRNK